MTPGQKAGLALAAGGVLLAAAMGAFDGLLRPGRSGNTDDDAHWLARLILTESSGGGVGKPEGAGIAHIAKAWLPRYGTIKGVITARAGSAWFGGIPRGTGYCYATSTLACPGRSRGGLVDDHPKFKVALDQAAGVLDGSIPNPTGLTNHFFHPGGMKRCDTPGDRTGGRDFRVCLDLGAGLRWAPGWGLTRDQGGVASRTERVGPAVFSGV